MVRDAGTWDTLRYSIIPVEAAANLVGERLPAALDLTLGFNSLDGD